MSGVQYKGLGWLWHREEEGMLWHRALQGASACGAPVRGKGQRDAPPTADEVCEVCARATRFRRRRKTPAQLRVRVRLPARELREVRRAGLDPVEVLVAGWRAELDRRRPLLAVHPDPGVPEEQRWAVYDAAVALLEGWGGKGVPIRALQKETRLPRGVIHALLGTPKTMRLGERGVHRAYPADRILDLGRRPANGGGT